LRLLKGYTLLNTRVTIIIIGILLCLALVGTAFAAFTAIQAVHTFQQQHTLAKEGDVSTIRPWMTVPYVAHTYHVPESYLYQSLHISGQHPPRHVPLHVLAARYHRPVSEVVHELQMSILTYRKQHKYTPTHTSIRHLLLMRRFVR